MACHDDSTVNIISVIIGSPNGPVFFACWRLSASVVVVCNTASGLSGSRHCSAGQSCYIPLGRHLVIIIIIIIAYMRLNIQSCLLPYPYHPHPKLVCQCRVCMYVVAGRGEPRSTNGPRVLQTGSDDVGQYRRHAATHGSGASDRPVRPQRRHLCVRRPVLVHLCRNGPTSDPLRSLHQQGHALCASTKRLTALFT